MNSIYFFVHIKYESVILKESIVFYILMLEQVFQLEYQASTNKFTIYCASQRSHISTIDFNKYRQPKNCNEC